MQNIRTMLDRVEVLPVSPALLPKLLPFLSDLNSNFDEVVRIISLEQSLTAKLLQICNSAFFGLEEPVSSVHEAVNRVGYQSIYLLTAMINGSSCFPQTSFGGLNSAQLWKHSVSAAFNSKFAAESAGLDSNLLFTAGLMHDIGKVILAQGITVNNGVDFHQPATFDSLEGELLLFGVNHATIGASLLEKWQLPPQLVACIRYHHDPQSAGDFQKLAATVTIGDCLAHSAEQPEVTRNAPFMAAMEILRMDSSHLKRWNAQFCESGDLIAGMSKLPL